MGSIFGCLFLVVLEPFRRILGVHFGLSEAVLGRLGPQKPAKTKGLLNLWKCTSLGL